ncbi:MAG: LysE family translocator [Alphaproteobacteria bacterium]|nr:LysE family translocator [Alphaproteobacteria bacterium]
MTIDVLMALAGFAFVASITPGPSNLILLASGVNFGFWRSAPVVLGVSFGFLSMLLIVGLGVGQVLQTSETVYTILKIVSVLYVVWLAWKIATSSPMRAEDDEAAARPLTFWQAGLLQWVNPKAWTVALIVTVSYTSPADYLPSLLLITLLFGLVNLPSISTWAVFGVVLRQILVDPRKVRVFNVVMAVLLVASMAPLLVDFAAGS